MVAAHGDRELEAVTVARLDRDWNVLSARRVPCDTLATGYGFVPPARPRDPARLRHPPGRRRHPGALRRRRPAHHRPRRLGRGRAHRRRRPPPGRARRPRRGPVHRGSPRDRPGDTRRRRAGRPAEETDADARVRRRAAGRLPRQGRMARLAAGRHDRLPVRGGAAGRDPRGARAGGATDARSAKLLSRAGMGWCQGRVCAYPVACLVGGGQAAPRRPIAQPVTLAALAELTLEEPHD
ncbi:hypothetical protein ACFSTC_23450 [Nonomuraea ferruginea]